MDLIEQHHVVIYIYIYLYYVTFSYSIHSRKYLFLFIMLYIYIDIVFTPLHGVLRLCLVLQMGLVSALKTGLKGDKPWRLRMRLRCMWLRHSLGYVVFPIHYYIKKQKNKFIIPVSSAAKHKHLHVTFYCTAARGCGKILCTSKNLQIMLAWLPAPLQHSVSTASHQTVVVA